MFVPISDPRAGAPTPVLARCRPETGVAPAVAAAGTWLLTVADKVGTALTWTAAVDWVLSIFGDDEDAIQAAIDEPLTDNARLYLLSVEMLNWQTAALKSFTGSRLAAAMKGVEQGRLLIAAPTSTLVTRQAVPKSLQLLFAELTKKERAATGGGGSGVSGGGTQPPTKPSAKPPSKPSAPHKPAPSIAPWTGPSTSSLPPQSGSGTAGGTRAVHAGVVSKTPDWLVPTVVVGVAGVGVWLWRKRS